MARTRESIVFIDTHIVIWLFENQQSQFSNSIRKLMNLNEIMVSPIVLLELTYLKEINRIADSSETIYSKLNSTFGLQNSPVRFNQVINNALNIRWTRDVFDRLIVANAAINKNILITADRNILKHYSSALAPK